MRGTGEEEGIRQGGVREVDEGGIAELHIAEPGGLTELGAGEIEVSGDGRAIQAEQADGVSHKQQVGIEAVMTEVGPLPEVDIAEVGGVAEGVLPEADGGVHQVVVGVAVAGAMGLEGDDGGEVEVGAFEHFGFDGGGTGVLLVGGEV